MTIDPFTTLITATGWAAALFVWTNVKNSLQSYMTEKFKNIAAKEDVAILTRAVQAVELEFSSAFARLQSDLELVRGHETRIATAEFDSLLAFHRSAIRIAYFVLPEAYRRAMGAECAPDVVPHLQWKSRLSRSASATCSCVPSRRDSRDSQGPATTA